MKIGSRVSTIRSIQQKFAGVADPYKRERLIKAALGRAKIRFDANTNAFEFGLPLLKRIKNALGLRKVGDKAYKRVRRLKRLRKKKLLGLESKLENFHFGVRKIKRRLRRLTKMQTRVDNISANRGNPGYHHPKMEEALDKADEMSKMLQKDIDQGDARLAYKEASGEARAKAKREKKHQQQQQQQQAGARREKKERKERAKERAKKKREERIANAANRNTSATETQVHLKKLREPKQKYPLATTTTSRRPGESPAKKRNKYIKPALYGGGALATVGAGVGAKKIMDKRKKRKTTEFAETHREWSGKKEEAIGKYPKSRKQEIKARIRGITQGASKVYKANDYTPEQRAYQKKHKAYVRRNPEPVSTEFSALDELLELDSAPLSTYREWKHMMKGRDTLRGMRNSALRDEAIRRRKKIMRRGGAAAILGLGAYGGVKLMKRGKRDDIPRAPRRTGYKRSEM
jgi:hypothetical protein